MRRFPSCSLDPWALLGLALFWFFDTQGILAAALPAVLIHEAGHWFALRLAGARVTRLRLEPGGLVMDYAGTISAAAEALCALAGPFAGLLWAGFAAGLGGTYLLRSAGASLCLTGFNLLPLQPLDGGRALAALAGVRAAAITGRVCCLLLLLLSAAAGLLLGRGAVPLLATLSLLGLQLRKENQDFRLPFSR